MLARFYGAERAERMAAAVSLALLFGMALVGFVTRQPVPIYLAVVIAYDVWRKHLRGRAAAEA